MKKLFRSRVIIPLVLGVALLAALLAFGNIGDVVAFMAGFQLVYLLYFLLLTGAYEAVRCVQWHYLLKKLDIHVPLRSQVFAFAAGEVTKSLPIGNFFQNYLLHEARGTDFGLSSVATTLIILIEVGVSLIGVVIIGVGSMSGVLRPVIIIGCFIFGLLAWTAYMFHKSAHAPGWMKRHRMLQSALVEIRHFREGTTALSHPRVVVVATLLGATYLIIGGAALYIVVLGLGITHISLWNALAVYFFSLAVALIFPLPVDIGVLELSIVGAFLAFGASRSAAVGMALVNRALSIGASIAIALVTILLLHDEFRAAMRGRPRQGVQKPASASKSDDQG